MIRRQLSLYAEGPLRARLEAVRTLVDPVQAALIPAHVTLCRDEEVADLDADAMAQRLRGATRLRLAFGAAERFSGHGILLPCVSGQDAFHALRQRALGRLDVRRAEAHLTLAHQRNPRAAGNDLAAACALPVPMGLEFEQVQLIEQAAMAPWRVLGVFALAG
jgi:hypothetical protein